MKVRHDRGRILEENHYYTFGLKIAALSSKAFAAPNNAYGYQGDYSEFDDDLGWNDFMLRCYDPQIGRFLQNDPYDQFASGYVGMGNDPVNGVDPSGGLFGVGGGVGCAATAGMSGYGGMAGRISGASNMVSVVSTVATVSSMAMRGVGLANSVSQWQSNINQAKNNPSNESSEESTSSKFFQFNKNKEDGEDDENVLTPKIWYYILKTEDGPHSLVYDPENDMIYETNHPTVNGEAVNGRENWKAGGDKSQGYAYDMGDENDAKDFWAFMGGRGTLLLSPVVVLKPERATAFFERNKGKKWDYNIAANNCKHYVIRGLTAGAALIPPSQYIDPFPFSWPIPYTKFWNSSMPKPQSILNIINK